MMNYFEKLAQDAYKLASKYGPLEEQTKIKQEASKVMFIFIFTKHKPSLDQKAAFAA